MRESKYKQREVAKGNVAKDVKNDERKEMSFKKRGKTRQIEIEANRNGGSKYKKNMGNRAWGRA